MELGSSQALSNMYGDPFASSGGALSVERKRELITDAVFNDYW